MSGQTHRPQIKNIVYGFCEIDNLILPIRRRITKYSRKYHVEDKLNDAEIESTGCCDMLVEKNAAKLFLDSNQVQKEDSSIRISCTAATLM